MIKKIYVYEVNVFIVDLKTNNFYRVYSDTAVFKEKQKSYSVIYRTFEEFYEMAKEAIFLDTGKTAIFKKPCVRFISNGHKYEYVKARRLDVAKGVEVLYSFTKATPSMEWIQKNMNIHDAIDYVRQCME